MLGKLISILSLTLIEVGAFTLITLSKLVFEASNSVFAFIRLALAPAREDSDWAKSVKVISPFCSLALSDSTCLSNKFTLDKLNSSFLVLNIKSKYAEIVSKLSVVQFV